MNNFFKNRTAIFILIFIVVVIGIVIPLTFNRKSGGDNENKKEVTLYFSTKDAMYLVGEKREMNDEGLYRNTIEGLIDGPQSSKLNKTIPEGVKLLGIIVKAGTAFVDFNQALVKNHWGGSSGESLTVYSVVNTMTQFPDIDRVQFLIEGEKVETLAGHMYLMDPIDRDDNIIKDNDD